ncbi:uncharacterized protein PAC_16323 [Phialocephala subalpina]|uniref:Ankyrin repeat protein n=1 Tax=Phialocephala subalpina TaxID=576137 RepID=A0A1L7XN05_9HELO|nr:uncharacterized protein PAC_16323 [Phialocephala subalpina]
MGDREWPHTCLSDDANHPIRHVTSHYFACLSVAQQSSFRPDPNQTIEELEEIQKAEEKIENRIKRLGRLPDVANLKKEINELRDLFLPSRVQNALGGNSAQRHEIIAHDFSTADGAVPHQSLPSSTTQVSPSHVGPNYEMKASMIFFDPRSPQDLEQQKMSVHDLTKTNLSNGGKNPLRENCPAHKFRYFHLPHNHMKWVMAIATLNREEIPEYHGIHQETRIDKMTTTEMIFRPQFWRGQQHGSHEDAVHARYMRPHCESICTHKSSIEKENQHNDNNLVLFMPYAHWEIDRQRARFSQVIQERTENELIEIGGAELEKKERRKWREDTKAGREPAATNTNTEELLDAFRSRLQKEKTELVPRIRKSNTFFDVVMAISDLARDKPGDDLISGKRVDKLESIRAYFEPEKLVLMEKIKSDRTLAISEELYHIWKGNVLLQIFLRAAAFFERIAWHDAEEMMKASLYESPPLHPRRTLDQAYYWTLKSTNVRDRDQTVYRATTPQKQYMHHPGCRLKADSLEEDEQKKDRCKHHTHCWKKRGCDQCKDDVRKRSSIVMVDQLWLWILDGNTIITAFPEDGQGISMMPLGFIKNNKQIIAYNHLWKCARNLAKDRKSQDAATIEALEKYILSINSEGELLKEIDDVKDELRMMMYFKERQQHVLEEFETHVKHILDQSLERLERKRQEQPKQVEVGSTSRPGNQENNCTYRQWSGKKESPWVITDESAKWSKANIEDRKKSLKGQMAELQGLHSSAEQTTAAIQHLLSLKQQQASLIQAREALEQSRETVRQGLSIMAFTIITVLFLPLSFRASIFGMNVTDFQNGLATLRHEMEIIFPTSLFITFVACILAFNKSTRASLYSITSYSYYWIITSTCLYSGWKSLHLDSQSMYRRIGKAIGRMKNEAIQRNLRKKEAAKPREADEIRRRRPNVPSPESA